MTKKFLIPIITLSIVLFHYSSAAAFPQEKSEGWKAGIAKVLITPEQPMWMAGYGARKHESEGTLVDLWAKALALGGYEGDTSQRGYGLPGVWSESIESLILQEMIKLAEEAGIPQSTIKLPQSSG